MLALIFLAACRSGTAQDLHQQGKQTKQKVEFAATVVYVPLEGGFYGLRTDGGRQYEPRNLPAAMRKDGLRVRVRGILVTGVASFRQWGVPLDILHIESR